MISTTLAGALLPAFLVTATLASAQTGTVAVLAGDTFTGVSGVVESISQVTISEAGWLVEARTSSPHEMD